MSRAKPLVRVYGSEKTVRQPVGPRELWVPSAPGNLKPMFLNRSTGRRFLVTVVGALFFAVLYEVTVMDSRFAARQPDIELTAAPIRAHAPTSPPPATAAGRPPRRASSTLGHRGGRPGLLPVGSVVQIDKLLDRYTAFTRSWTRAPRFTAGTWTSISGTATRLWSSDGGTC